VVVFAIILYVPIFLLPIFLGQVKNMSPLNIRLIISTMGVAWMLSGSFVGKLLKVIRGRLVVVIGAIFIGIGTYAQTTITADLLSMNYLFLKLQKELELNFYG
jgi:hypothetical protein